MFGLKDRVVKKVFRLDENRIQKSSKFTFAVHYVQSTKEYRLFLWIFLKETKDQNWWDFFRELVWHKLHTSVLWKRAWWRIKATRLYWRFEVRIPHSKNDWQKTFNFQCSKQSNWSSGFALNLFSSISIPIKSCSGLSI